MSEKEMEKLQARLLLIEDALFALHERCIKDDHCLYCSGEWTGYYHSQSFEHTPGCPMSFVEKLEKLRYYPEA